MLFLWYPKCTTCQKAKAFLDERGVSYEARDIKLENPTAEELRGWWEKSGMPLKLSLIHIFPRVFYHPNQ